MKMLRSVLTFSLIGLLSGCGALQSIDKGLYSVADAVSETDAVTGQRSLSLAARPQQIQQGNAYVKQLLANEQAKGRPVNHKVSAAMYTRLMRVFKRIHSVSHFRDEPWQAVLIERDSFNAFTTGGTYIVVHSELMKQLTSDDELAAVVGHEVAHTVANHVFERQTHSQLAALSGSKTARTGVYQAAFTHENEREADRIGILYSALAGFNPKAASDIWLRQYQKEGNARALFAHSHPVNSERHAEALAVANKVMPYYQPGKINENYAALLENNVLWRKSTGSTAAGEGGGVQAVLSTALGAFVQHQKSKAEAARQVANAQFIQAVEAQLEVQRQQLSAKSLTVWLKYKAGPTLTNMTIGLMVKQEKALKRSVVRVDGQVPAGRQFKIVLPLPEGVSAKQIESQGAKLYVDDAKPL